MKPCAKDEFVAISVLDLFSSPSAAGGPWLPAMGFMTPMLFSTSVSKEGAEIFMEQLDQQQLQEVRTELIVEQYHSLREEIIQRVQARQQMWYVLLLVAGTFLTIGVQPGIAAWTILLYPLIALFFSVNWAHNDTRIDQITWYIYHEVEKPLQFIGWETYRTQKFRRKRGIEQHSHPLALVPGLLTFSARGVFLTTQLLSTGIGIMRLVQSGMIALALPSLLIDLIATIATYFLLIDRKVQMLRENEKMPTKKSEKTNSE